MTEEDLNKKIKYIIETDNREIDFRGMFVDIIRNQNRDHKMSTSVLNSVYHLSMESGLGEKKMMFITILVLLNNLDDIYEEHLNQLMMYAKYNPYMMDKDDKELYGKSPLEKLLGIINRYERIKELNKKRQP